MSNEELVELARNGDREALAQLWAQVRGLVYKQASKWAVYAGGGVTLEDLIQSGAVAMLLAVNTFDSTKGTKFSTYLFPRLRAEFTAATGWATKRGQLDPLQNAISIDAPLTDDDEDPFTLANTVEDPAAAAEIESTDIRLAVAAALSKLPEDQRRAVVGKYWYGLSVDVKAHAAALRYLRHPARSKQLMAYL